MGLCSGHAFVAVTLFLYSVVDVSLRTELQFGCTIYFSYVYHLLCSVTCNPYVDFVTYYETE